MSNVWAVIRREYLQRVRSKWFIIATIGGPLFMAAMIFVPAYFTARGEMNERNIAVVDRTGILYDRVFDRLEEGGYTLEEAAWSDDVVAELTQRVTDEELGGFLVLDDETLREGRSVLHGTSSPSSVRRLMIRQAVVAAALESQLEGQGVDAGALLGGGDLEISLVSGEGSDTSEQEMVVGFIGSFFLYMVILLYAVSVMRATLEEKTTRIVEVIISSMKPWHLMLGKILGVGAVGLTQMAVWALSGVLIVSAGIPALLAARPELATLENLRDILPGAGLLVLFVGFFVFGFFMFSGLYAAVGAMCNSDEEAQQAQFPVMLLIIVPILFMTPVMEDPGSSMATGLSMFPFFTPILMWPRVVAGAAPVWQVATSFALMALAVVAVAWLAGRIYKVGILMAGKRPTLPELVRWVREA